MRQIDAAVWITWPASQACGNVASSFVQAKGLSPACGWLIEIKAGHRRLDYTIRKPLEEMMNAASVMTTPVITLSTQALLRDAVTLMTDHAIGGVPIVDEVGNLVGMLTEGDLMRRQELGTAERRWSGWRHFLRGDGQTAADYVRTHSERVVELMSGQPISVAETAPLSEVVQLMETKGIKRVPVVHNGKLVGIISRSDLLRAVRRAINQAAPPAGTDQDLVHAVQQELRRQPWFSDRNVTFSAANGGFKLDGIAGDADVAAAIRCAVRNVVGCRALVDNLVIVTAGPEVFMAVP